MSFTSSQCCYPPLLVLLVGVVMVSVRHVDPESRHLSSRVVTTKYGALRGFISTLSNRQLQPVEVFLGVPYAGAPKGALRFMPPVTSPHWRGVRMADHFGPVCPQRLPDLSNETQALKKMPAGRLQYLRRLLPYLTNQSEDCLYLNIYAPAVVGREPVKLPVMVYIHGESYDWNAGNPYDGRVLASFGNVVVVTINYRLGVLGFLPGVDGSARGNYGLMDQVAALHWIQENIAEFGGDSSNVTVFGQGQGAACVNLLMLSPMARGLFHRAIMQSGSALSPWAIAHDAIAYTLQMAKVLNCPANDNTALVECLRKRTVADIMGIELTVPDHLTAFGPTIDGIVLPHDPAVLMEKFSDLYAQYDLMFGTTRIESYFQFSAMEERFGIESARRDRVLRTLVRNLFTYHLQEIFLTIVNEYMDWSRPQLHPTDIFDGTVDALGDALVVAPVIRAGNLHAHVKHLKTFFYVFGHQTEDADYTSRLGCITGEDLPYVFGAPLVVGLSHFGTNYSRTEMVLSEVVMTHWTNFAKVGDPNFVTQEVDSQGDNVRSRYERVIWPAYEPVHQKYLSISMKPRIRDHYHAHRLSYWLNLIPRLHRSGDANVSAQHHLLHDHDNPFTYDGVVKQDDGDFSTVPTDYPSSGSAVTLFTLHDLLRNSTEEFDSQQTTVGSKEWIHDTDLATDGSNLSEPLLITTHHGVYSTALSVTIAVGCSLLILNVLIFAGIYYQRDKDNLEKKLQKAFYQVRRTEDEEAHQTGEKPFLVKDASSMMTQFGPHQEYMSHAQPLDLVQGKVPHQGNLQTPEKKGSLPESQPLLPTAECGLPGWPPAQEMTVFGLDCHS